MKLGSFPWIAFVCTLAMTISCSDNQFNSNTKPQKQGANFPGDQNSFYNPNLNGNNSGPNSYPNNNNGSNYPANSDSSVTNGSGMAGSFDSIRNDPKAFQSHILFASSQLIAGNKIGEGSPMNHMTQAQQRADGICNQLATSAGLKGGYKALLTTVIKPANLINMNFKIYNTKGELIANQGTELWNSGPQRPVGYDERAQVISGESGVWTGSNGGGGVAMDLGTCMFWRHAMWGHYGNATATGKQWINSGNDSCTVQKRLYCISNK